MDEPASYPPIQPSNFDLIVIGTGLPETILAVAASLAGKTVLILDHNPFYGGHFASLPLRDFTDFLKTHSKPDPEPGIQPTPYSSGEFNVLPLTTRPVYSSVEISVNSPEILEGSGELSLDLAGPRVLLYADAMVELILKMDTILNMDINDFIKFKTIDASFIYIDDDEGGKKLWNFVPDSRRAIFKDKSLSLTEKNQLMRFYKLVRGHFGDGSDEENKKISEEDLESPFLEFLSQKIGLSSKLKSIILYAISMADYGQDNAENCKHVVKTKDGIDRLMLYHSSVGRFPNAPGAMIYPIYGQGELPLLAFFSRVRAAGKGCLEGQRMTVVGLLADKDVGNYKGVKLVSGQELFSHQLILGPSFILPSALCPEQLTSVRVFQLSSNMNVCPSGMFVVYLSTICEYAAQGKKLISAAIDALFSIPVSENCEEDSMDHQSKVGKVKPKLLWSIVYIQEQTGGVSHGVSSATMPDGNLQYNNLVDATTKLFQNMYPKEEFFSYTTSSNVVTEDSAPVLKC